MEPLGRPQEGAIARTELALLAVGALVLSLVASWPLILHLGDSLPDLGFGDPYLFSWQMAWDAHALVTAPLEILDTNTFWPLSGDLVFQDAFHGFSPLALIGEGTAAAVIRYNFVYLFAGTLAFIGAYLLAREIGLGPIGAVAAGIAFAYAPWRIDQHTHIHVISSGGVPLTLFLLLRGYRARRAGLVLAGWVVATWQMSLGFTLGIQFAYLLLAIGIVCIVWWLKAGRPQVAAPLIRATAVGIVLFAGWTIWQALPYLQLQDRLPEARRTTEELGFYSPGLGGFGAASENNLLWGEVTEPVREKLRWPTEQTLFPGVATIVLVALGARFAGLPKRLRSLLVGSLLVTGFLALGFGTSASTAVYEVLYEIAPGWDAIRTPGRLMTLATVASSLLAGAGLQRLWDARGGHSGRSRPLATGALIALTAVLWFEGLGTTPLSTPPPVPEAQQLARPPILHLPTNGIHDRVYTFWSTEGFPEIVNGVGVLDLRHTRELRASVRGFPDGSSVAMLRELGARTVIVHLDRLEDPDAWLQAATERARDLGLDERIVGRSIVYELDDN